MNRLISSVSLAALAMLPMTTAQADIVLVVSAKSTAGNINHDQVEDIYRLRMKELPGASGQVMPLMQGNGAEKDEFLSKVLSATDAQMKGYWAKLTFTGKGVPPKEVANDAEMKAMLTANPNMIGYISNSAVDSSVKILFKP